MKKVEKYDVAKPEWNLISKEEVSLLKMKLGKSHRKESDWEVIKEILGRRSVLTFILPKRVKGLTTIEKVLCEDGNLIVFTNIDDCTRHIQVLQFKGKFWGYVEIGYIPFENVLDIAGQHGMNVLIDVNDEVNCKCLMYESEEQRLKAVIMTYLK
ncbi:MAG: hypothetical protein K2G51_01710 [Lachnospiraceae bacterium]|nr:hypothetical protein [Lachnospiraceae bacterium]